jgi:hypothetical protein
MRFSTTGLEKGGRYLFVPKMRSFVQMLRLRQYIFKTLGNICAKK